MIKLKTTQREDYLPIVIDLTGEEGNAFALMSYAWGIGKQVGMERSEIEKVVFDMQQGDYTNLVKVFDANFGDLVLLLTNQNELV